MLDLVWKDVQAARRVLLLVLPLALVQLASFSTIGPLFPLATLLVSGLLAFGSIPLEEMQRTETLWGSLPVSRGRIVAARYLTALAGLVSGLGLSLAVGGTISLLPGARAAADTAFVGLAMHAILLVVMVLLAAGYLPFYFGWGAGRGTMLFAAASTGLLLLGSVAGQIALLVRGRPNPLLQAETWRRAGPALQERLGAWIESRGVTLLAILIVFSACAYVFSALVSRRLYEKRDL